MDLPYNNKNVILGENNLNDFLVNWGHDGVVKDVNLFRKAFVHRSYCTRKNETFQTGNVNCPQNCLPLQEESSERLEFLGDAVINIIVGHYLFERFPDENEGFLTKMRTKLVNGIMLAQLGNSIGLSKYVIISKQIEDNGGRYAVNVVEDCFEAFVGAMFLDNDNVLDKAYTWLTTIIETTLDFSELIMQNTNYKEILIKHYQYAYGHAPTFQEAPSKNSLCGVSAIDNKNTIIGTGYGKSKKLAEYECAKNILVLLKLV